MFTRQTATKNAFLNTLKYIWFKTKILNISRLEFFRSQRENGFLVLVNKRDTFLQLYSRRKRNAFEFDITFIKNKCILKK